MSWRRVASALAIIFLSLAVLAFWFEPYFAARSMGVEIEMGVVPTPLVDSTEAKNPTSRVRRNGVSFEVPWCETDRSKGLPKSGMVVFTNGLGLYVHDPSLQFSIPKLVRGPRGLLAAVMRKELGSETLDSEYTFFSVAMKTTRNDAKWWRSPFYNKKVELLLTVKMQEVPTIFDRRIPIYEVHFGDIHGFQIGDPHETHDVMKLILFDGAGHGCRIDLAQRGGGLRQSELNSLMASLKFDPNK